jgi:hypothetical protein
MAKAKKIKSKMGYNTNRTAFILGPYLECVFGKYEEKSKTVEVDKCEKCGEKLWRLRTHYNQDVLVDEFCKHCGGKIIRTKEESDPEPMPPLDVDDLCKKHKVYKVFFGEDWPEDTEDHVAHYISLWAGVSGRRAGMFSIDTEAPDPMNFTPDDVQSEIDNARRKHSKLIQDCYDRFGKKNVILHWGLLPCWYDW